MPILILTSVGLACATLVTLIIKTEDEQYQKYQERLSIQRRANYVNYGRYIYDMNSSRHYSDSDLNSDSDSDTYYHDLDFSNIRSNSI